MKSMFKVAHQRPELGMAQLPPNTVSSYLVGTGITATLLAYSSTLCTDCLPSFVQANGTNCLLMPI